MKFRSNWQIYPNYLSFITDVFQLVLKTAKVVPVFMKDSKLCCSNYCAISQLSNIEKVLEKRMYTFVYIPVSITITLSIN